MNQKILILAAALGAVFVLVGGLAVYNAVLGETEAASGPLTAPTLVVQAAAATAVPVQPSATAALAVQPAATEVSPATPTAEVAAEAAAAGGNNTLPATGADPVIYEINQAESEARFTIYELLRGSPKDVVGTTDQVAGQVAVDLNDLNTAQLGEILINARTLVTDDDRRNGAIRNRILFTDQYEFISFRPTQISGLSGSAAVGQTFTFQVSGDLTIRDATQPATFDVTMTVESLDRLVGTAKSTLRRADYGINIPSVPFVANVGEEVAVEIDLVLAPKP